MNEQCESETEPQHYSNHNIRLQYTRMSVGK